MASTTALFTGLSGLNANARNIDVIGNNIANVNTTAYKSSRLMFSTVFGRTLTIGSAPSATSGGTNPFQIGMGVATAGTQRNMNGGTISATGDSRDLAIDGGGFFVVDRNGRELYTRAGAFRQNSNGDLVTINGERLRGYGVDANFNINTGSLVDLNVPVGAMTLAEATRNVTFAGNLNSDGDLPTQGSRILLSGSSGTGMTAIAAASPAPTFPNVVEPTTRIVDLEDPDLPGTGTSGFSAGQVFEVRGAEKGGKTLATASFTITATSTVQDLTDFITEALGIDTTTGPNPDGGVPSVAVNPLSGEINIIGNTGTANDLEVDGTDLRVVSSTGALIRNPVTATKSASADGESVRTTFVAFDSLGAPVEIDIAMVLDTRSSTGTTWRYFVESADDTDLALQVAGGTIAFDTNGQPVSSAPIPISIDRDNTGAVTPLTIDLNFGNPGDGVTSLADDSSELAATFRDGAPIGTLSGFAVGQDGVVYGAFTNGLIRTLGQVALATFANPEGLLESGNNVFAAGANSGTPVVSAPGAFSAGLIVGGSLELSNVDLGEEFIKLILSSTGYSASSRVIRTTEELMQQLLVLGR